MSSTERGVPVPPAVRASAEHDGQAHHDDRWQEVDQTLQEPEVPDGVDALGRRGLVLGVGRGVGHDVHEAEPHRREEDRGEAEQHPPATRLVSPEPVEPRWQRPNRLGGPCRPTPLLAAPRRSTRGGATLGRPGFGTFARRCSRATGPSARVAGGTRLGGRRPGRRGHTTRRARGSARRRLVCRGATSAREDAGAWRRGLGRRRWRLAAVGGVRRWLIGLDRPAGLALHWLRVPLRPTVGSRCLGRFGPRGPLSARRAVLRLSALLRRVAFGHDLPGYERAAQTREPRPRGPVTPPGTGRP